MKLPKLIAIGFLLISLSPCPVMGEDSGGKKKEKSPYIADNPGTAREILRELKDFFKRQEMERDLQEKMLRHVTTLGDYVDGSSAKLDESRRTVRRMEAEIENLKAEIDRLKATPKSKSK